jgi:hypothetical protein
LVLSWPWALRVGNDDEEEEEEEEEGYTVCSSGSGSWCQ